MATERELVDRFEAFLVTIGDRASRGLLDALDQYRQGRLDEQALTTAISSLLASANSYGRHYGDVFATSVLRLTDPAAVSAGALAPADELERLGKAASTLVSALGEDGIEDRLTRIGNAEPAHAAQQVVVQTYAENGVAGYTRGVNVGACELCQWLYKDGYVYPTGQAMHQHAGCRCVAIPSVSTTKEISA